MSVADRIEERSDFATMQARAEKAERELGEIK
jgi:hypothetical protein